MEPNETDANDLPLPLNTVDLIVWLDRAYPPACPPRGASLEDIHRYAGKRELIDEIFDWAQAEGRLVPVA